MLQALKTFFARFRAPRRKNHLANSYIYGIDDRKGNVSPDNIVVRSGKIPFNVELKNRYGPTKRAVDVLHERLGPPPMEEDRP